MKWSLEDILNDAQRITIRFSDPLWNHEIFPFNNIKLELVNVLCGSIFTNNSSLPTISSDMVWREMVMRL